MEEGHETREGKGGGFTENISKTTRASKGGQTVGSEGDSTVGQKRSGWGRVRNTLQD